jgi:glycosyltransferase involved in cell wall biosynthesis
MVKADSASELAPRETQEHRLARRVLIVSHSAVLYSGMAEVIRLIFSGLSERFGNEYDFEQVGLVHNSAVTTCAWPITPTAVISSLNGGSEFDRDDLYGQKTVPKVIERFKPDIVFCHNDPHAVEFLTRLRGKDNCPWKLVLYVNFDGVPVPAGYETLLDADLLVTLSDFSRCAYLKSLPINKRNDAHVDVLYCPADTTRFQPSDDHDSVRSANRPPWMAKNAFVLGWIGRNQWRKQTWIPYDLISRLRFGMYRFCARCGGVTCKKKSDKMPDQGRCGGCDWVDGKEMRDIVLWLHFPTGKERGPWHLEDLERTYGVLPGHDIYYTDGCSPTAHLTPEAMPALYQCFDTLLMLSGGEGFGLPAWEAMAAEVPVVYTDYSSSAEFLSKAQAGVGVSGILQPEPGTSILRMIPDVAECIAAIRRLYFGRDEARRLGRNGRTFVQGFTKHMLAEEWNRRFGAVLDSQGATR